LADDVQRSPNKSGTIVRSSLLAGAWSGSCLQVSLHLSLALLSPVGGFLASASRIPSFGRNAAFSVRSLSMTTPFTPPQKLKGLFVGSGSDGLQQDQISCAILSLTGKQPTNVNILYLGTATYDLPGPRERQTLRFIEAGCCVSALEVVNTAPGPLQLSAAVEAADVIVVSGGNTLFAVDRWIRLGLHQLLREAMERGAVLTGGSAGAICWFQGGHSDSMDPDSFKINMLAAAASQQGDESSTAPTNISEAKSWEYLRVDGLGFLPGLVCPHHDKVQSNGLLRALDFDSMLLRHDSELGIGIDHWAALEVCDGRFRVISVEGKEGSVLPDKTFSPDRKGVPGIWLKEVHDSKVEMRLCPSEGKLELLLRNPKVIKKDARTDACRIDNPDDAPGP